MSKKNILTNIWKFSATRSVALMLIIPTVGSLVALITFYFFLNQTKGDVMFIDVASRQRILSEQIGNYVHMVYDMGQEDDREPLRELVVAFDQYLAIIDQGGEIMGRRLSPSPPEIRDKIDIGKQLWKDLMPALLLVVDQPIDSPQVKKNIDYIQANVPRIRDISSKIVSGFELLSHTRKERILWVFITVFSLNLVLLFTGIVVTKRYLNERNQAEEWLRNSQQNYETLVNTIEGIVWEADARNLQFSFVSVQAERLLGYPAKRWLSEPEFWQSHIHPDDRDWAVAYCRMAIEKKQRQEFEYRMLTTDGKTIWLRDIVTVVVEEDKPVKLRGIMMDITVRKKAEKEVKKLSEVVQQSPDMVFITDPNGNIEYVNPAFERITGFSKAEAIGQTPRILKSGKMSAEYYKNIWATIQSGKSIQTDVINRKKNGDLFIHNQTITPLKDADGNTINFISTGKDITDQVETRKKLEKALEKAEQANRVKSLFLANMSHEIRTPLNAILGFTDLLATSTSHLISEEEKGFFDTIIKSGNRLMETVHEILDISQIEAGTYDLKMIQLDLVALVNDLVNGVKPAAAKKGLKIEYTSEIDSAFITADQYGISQAISNIIDNAIKYTEEGEITILLKKSSKQYVLSIKDTGIGISEEYLDNLFETFSQESEGYTKKYQGIGLGMAIAKRHLDMNQADIDVKSTKGVGTIVTLTFKQAQKLFPEKKVEKKEKEIALSPDSAEKPLILLVEDDPGSRKLVEFFLKEKYDLCFAVSVGEAKEQLKKYPVDLVLLDLSLVGNEDGLGLVRWMRKSENWKKTPVIATTAHAFTTDQNNCLAAGCNDYLSKPIKREKLLEKISAYI